MFAPSPVIWVQVDPMLHDNGPFCRPWNMAPFFWQRLWWPVYRMPHRDTIIISKVAERLHYHIAWNRLAPSLRQRLPRRAYNTAVFAEFVLAKKEAPAPIRSRGSKPYIGNADRQLMVQRWQQHVKENQCRPKQKQNTSPA